MSRAFVGEWIFSHALFDWDAAHDERYLCEVLLKPPAWLGRNTDAAADRRRDPRDLRARATPRAPSSTRAPTRVVAAAAARSSASPACSSSTSRRWRSPGASRQRLPGRLIVMGGANCEATMGVETVRQFAVRRRRGVGRSAIRCSPSWRRASSPGSRSTGCRRASPARRRACRRASAPAPTAPAVTDLDALPYPDFTDFFAQFERSRFGGDWQPSVFVETSRGCWWGERMHCTFCGLNGATMAYRSKSAPRALDELTHLADDAIPGCDIQVVDNILDLKYFKTLLPELAARKLNVSLFYETKSNLKKDQVRLLRDAGVLTIQPGIESFSDRVLKQMKKGVTGLQNIQLLKWCKEIGVASDLEFPDRVPARVGRRLLRDGGAVGAASATCREPSGVSVDPARSLQPELQPGRRELGFTKLRPLPFYEFLYDLPEAARHNLAYYFAYDYKVPQDVAALRRSAGQAACTPGRRPGSTPSWCRSISSDRLFVFDTRPRAKAPVSVLTRRGSRALSDLRRDHRREPARRARAPSGSQAIAAGGLMLNEGAKYLSLAVADRRLSAVARRDEAAAAAVRQRRRRRIVRASRARFTSVNRQPTGG